MKTTVFFDGGCPLCAREIAHYQRLDYHRKIQFIDITKDQTLLTALGVTYHSAQRRLHVLTSQGLLTDGAYAFAALWRNLPYYRRLAGLLYSLRLLGALDRLYEVFARWRYRQRCPGGACRDGLTEIS